MAQKKALILRQGISTSALWENSLLWGRGDVVCIVGYLAASLVPPTRCQCQAHPTATSRPP